MTASTAAYEGEDVWKLSGGVDTDGDPLAVVASVDPSDVVIITVVG